MRDLICSLPVGGRLLGTGRQVLFIVGEYDNTSTRPKGVKGFFVKWYVFQDMQLRSPDVVVSDLKATHSTKSDLSHHLQLTGGDGIAR